MKIAQINMVNSGSTGTIMQQLARCAREQGHLVHTYSARPFAKRYAKLPPSQEDHEYFGTYLENGIHYVLGSFLGLNGLFSWLGTWRLIGALRRFQPDVIHLHNLHKFCVSLPVLFRYLKRQSAPVLWTFHDCWSFTGHCPDLNLEACDKWKTGCGDCGAYKRYPKSRVDASRFMYRCKKRWFTGVPRLTVVTPSHWLANLAGQSYMREYPIRVMPNGVDTGIFKPSAGDFRQRYHCQDKFVLLGVAFGWSSQKGLDVFIALAGRLNPTFQIVLVGTDEAVKRRLPPNILPIDRTGSPQVLAEIYSAADLFVNPTYADNFPAVNLEALACGTPVVTFAVGGSREMLNGRCGFSVEKGNIDALQMEIERIARERPYKPEDCRSRAVEFDIRVRFGAYMRLYEDLTHCPKGSLS